MSLLKKWLRGEGLWLYAGHASDEIISHVFLDGGKAAVPRARADEFFEKYEACIKAGDLPCAVERLSAMGEGGDFRMFMDVDLKLFDGDLLKTARQILDALPVDLDSQVVVLHKAIESTRSGLHIVWDQVYVSSEVALSLLSMTVSNLTSMFPDSVVDWMRSLDGSVYRKSGLRMAYAAKSAADQAPYVPWFVSDLNEDGSREERFVEDPYVDVRGWLKRCSIIAPNLNADGKKRLSNGNLLHR